MNCCTDKLPKIEVKKLPNGYKQYFIDGTRVRANYSVGCRPKITLKDLGLIVKFQHRDIRHDDLRFYSKIASEDLQYFPKLIAATPDYSVHEFVPNTKLKDKNSHLYDKALALFRKYGFCDFDVCQFGKRKDSGELVIFDYGCL